MANTQRYLEYDLAHLKLVFEFSIYNVWKLVQYGVFNVLDMAYWGFLGVGTKFDIFQNIILIPYLEYGVLSPLDMAYWSLIFCGLCRCYLMSSTVLSQLQLDLLFSPPYDEFFDAGTSIVNKSSSPTDNSAQQDTQPSTNSHPTSEPSTPTMFRLSNSNLHTFNQPHDFKYRWTKDHPLTQVRGNPSKPVQTRRQLATDPEMCMFALTEELHQYDKLQVWELVDKPFGENVIKLKWLWKNKKDEDQTVIRNKARLVAKGYAQEEGLQIHQSPRGIFINQAKYALEILKKHGMEKGQNSGTPMATKPKLDADLSGTLVDQTDYHSKIGSLMYLTSSRPDIMQAFLGDKLVSWMSKKQDYTAMSSAEAEYVALSASCAQVMWMRTPLKDYGFNYNKIPLYYDSQSAIAISCNPVQHSRTKHIHTRYHFIKEQVKNGIIELYFVRTEYQLADMFTKALPEDRF
ncbi:retrovirus-related pol polyprotein from transposon TNT 1-94 [Tanacetum coccineum]